MSNERKSIDVEYATFSARLCAYFADVLPITLLVALFFYLALGFDETLPRYFLQGPRDPQGRRELLEERNAIRAFAGLAYVLYATLMHACPWRSTLGKLLFHIRIVDASGARIGWRRAFWRTGAMIFSIASGCIGCRAVRWSKTRQSWHDRLAGTYVVTSGPRQVGDMQAE
jgi:uncharacterized RDD family membrane protein YckC